MHSAAARSRATRHRLPQVGGMQRRQPMARSPLPSVTPILAMAIMRRRQRFTGWDCRRDRSTPMKSIPALASHWRNRGIWRSEEHTSELQSLMRISYAVFCLKKKTYIYYDHALSFTHLTSTDNSYNPIYPPHPAQYTRSDNTQNRHRSNS